MPQSGMTWLDDHDRRPGLQLIRRLPVSMALPFQGTLTRASFYRGAQNSKGFRMGGPNDWMSACLKWASHE